MTRSALHFSESEYEQMIAQMHLKRQNPSQSDKPSVTNLQEPPKEFHPSRNKTPTDPPPKKHTPRGTLPDSASSPLNESSSSDLTELLRLQNKTEKNKKRQGVQEDPILTSISQASFYTESSPTHLTLYFPDLRLFTLNELFALLQYRKYIVFKYKKSIHQLVHKALASITNTNRPYFSQPCHITLYRSGTKRIDRDNFESMFKALIDGLKKTKANPIGVIADDNPDILYSDTKIQSVGQPSIALRIELITPTPSICTYSNPLLLFNQPPVIEPTDQNPTKAPLATKSAKTKKAQ